MSTNAGAIGNDLNANNSSVFSALTVGYRYSDGVIGEWDLTNLSGHKVANGTYLIVLKTEDVTGTTQIYKRKVGVKKD